MYAYRLQVFRAVATHGSYSRAAREALHISQPAVTLADLVGETWILREEGSASGRLAERALRTHHLVQGHTLVLQGSEGVKQAVIAGLGIAMVSRFAITLEVQQGVLRVLSVTDLQIERDLSMIWRKDVRLPTAVMAFLDMQE